MRVVALTSIFPNALNPRYAPYTRQQAVALSRRCDLRMLALVPWFPGTRLLSRWSHWGKDFSVLPAREVIDGLPVEHPRCLRIPRIGLPLSAATYAASLLPVLARARRDIDALFATFVYPDGAAALAVGAALGLPVVVQAIGSDVNVIAQQPAPQRQLRWALPRAGGLVAVSAPLADELARLGARRDRVAVIPTGLDGDLFRPRDRAAARAELGEPPDARLVLFVGRLVVEKGIPELLDAFQQLVAEDPRCRLAIIGEGPARELCAQRPALAAHLRLVGECDMPQIATWLAACDLLALPSHREGTPNVILEALGSGRRVVATRVGGIPAVVRGAAQGALVPPQDPAALAAAIRHVLSEPYDPAEVARSVDLLTWDENARQVAGVLESAVERHHSVRGIV